ncbi:MAG TPA: alanine racemase [Gammaproteobacteria bacterium]|nr:alanine racemase [Gammaproteobacteria bacterium]
MSRTAEAVIDVDALRHNLGVARAAAPGGKILAIIKADAYGHGLVAVARALGGADAFGVACLDEGVALRQGGIKKDIVLLAGVLDQAALAGADRHRLSLVVHSEHQIAALQAARLSAPLKVWLKVDTGMHRLGFSVAVAAAAWRRLAACSNVISPPGWMSHFANADLRTDPRTAQQLAVFHAVIADAPGPRSIANSAALLAWPASHADWQRPGLMLYGVSPFEDSSGGDLGLRAAMCFTSRLVAIKPLPRGAAVGYGGDWVCPEDTVMGIVAAGYGDGYPRHTPSGTPVYVNGALVPRVGRVSMDTLCVDLGRNSAARVGDAVELWGRHLPVETIARAAGTIPYELLCKVTGRVARRYRTRAGDE